MNYQEWLETKYREWEKAQSDRQTYYNFARYLDVSHAALTQWINGISAPDGDDLAKIAGKLGNEIYALVGAQQPDSLYERMSASFSRLPLAMRERLSSAIVDADDQIRNRQLDPESVDAKRLVVKVFEKWGFHITG